MRCFFAVDLTDPVRAQILTIQKHLALSEADVKWTQEAQLHVTLRFLGDISEAQRSILEPAVEESLSKLSSFQLRLDSIGAFPNLKAPRILWFGIDEGSDALTILAKCLEALCSQSPLHLPPEKRSFRAHVTLGRIRSGKNRRRLVELLETASVPTPNTVYVRSVSFTKSTLSAQGPTYTLLRSFTLKED